MSTITVIGSMSDDPELRYPPSGVAVCTFRIGENTAKRGETAKWTNYRCVAFGSLAENVAASLVKSDRVLVTGRMEEQEYETREGEKRKSMQLVVEECGPAIRFATVEVERNERKA